MIFTKPSDLKWRHAPLPAITPRAEREGHVLLVVVANAHATLITKAIPRRSDHGVLEWVGLGAYAFVPIASLGEPRFYAVLRDEPYMPGCGPCARHDPALEEPCPHRVAVLRDVEGMPRGFGEYVCRRCDAPIPSLAGAGRTVRPVIMDGGPTSSLGDNGRPPQVLVQTQPGVYAETALSIAGMV